MSTAWIIWFLSVETPFLISSKLKTFLLMVSARFLCKRFSVLTENECPNGWFYCEVWFSHTLTGETPVFFRRTPRQMPQKPLQKGLWNRLEPFEKVPPHEWYFLIRPKLSPNSYILQTATKLPPNPPQNDRIPIVSTSFGHKRMTINRWNQGAGGEMP